MPESDDIVEEPLDSEGRFEKSFGDEVTQGSDMHVFILGEQSTSGEFYQPERGYVPEGEELADLSKRYRVEDKPRGRSGFGAVFEAFDERLNRKVPIKRILGKAAASGTITEKQAEGMNKPPPNIGFRTEKYLTFDVSFMSL
ncbi:hypothetical protein OAI33_13490 [Pirellulaceae bacterium]|nr:hypothetical protein [Pirellulaceae bacterium]